MIGGSIRPGEPVQDSAAATWPTPATASDEFARSFHILMKGAIVQAGEGDVDAATRAQAMARDLIEKYR